jgi:RNA polymerase sporulation-specific sigma factor
MNSLENCDLASLISLIRNGSCADEAFAELLSRYMPLLKSRVSRLSSSAVDSLEAMQEARIALHNAALSYDPDRCNGVTFGLYADICIANKLRTLLSKNSRHSVNETQLCDADRVASGVDIESFVATRDLCERVMAIAATVLSEYEFEVFRLTFERYTTRDIAAKLGKSAKSVDNAKNRISRSLRKNRDICDILLDFC